MHVKDSHVLHVNEVFTLSPAKELEIKGSHHRQITNPFNLPAGLIYAYMFIARDSPHSFVAKKKAHHNYEADKDWHYYVAKAA